MSDLLSLAHATRERAQFLQDQARAATARSVELCLMGEELQRRILADRTQSVERRDILAILAVRRHYHSAAQAPVSACLLNALRSR